MTNIKNPNKIVSIVFILVVSFFITTNVFAHEHTADCYGGTLHICQGDETNGGACYSQIEENCLGTFTYVPKDTGTLICPNCGAENGNYIKYIGTCSSCAYSGIAYKYDRETCSSCGTSLKKSDETLTLGQNCPTKTTKYVKTCGKTSGKYYNSQGQYLTPMCNVVVVSITPKYPNQTSDKPDLTLIATYLDGHTAEVQPMGTNYVNGMTYNNDTIQLSYAGTISRVGNTGTLTTSFILTSATQPTPTPTATPTPVPTTTPIVTPTPTVIPTPTPILTTPTPIVSQEQPINNTTTEDTNIANQTNTTTEVVNTQEDNALVETINPQENNTSVNKEIGEATYYEQDQEEIQVLPNIEKRDLSREDKATGIFTIAMIILAAIFGLIFLTTLIVFIIKKMQPRKTPNQVDLERYFRDNNNRYY